MNRDRIQRKEFVPSVYHLEKSELSSELNTSFGSSSTSPPKPSQSPNSFMFSQHIQMESAISHCSYDIRIPQASSKPPSNVPSFQQSTTRVSDPVAPPSPVYSITILFYQ